MITKAGIITAISLENPSTSKLKAAPTNATAPANATPNTNIAPAIFINPIETLS